MSDGLTGNNLDDNFITVKCPFCGSDKYSQFRAVSDIVKCLNCGTVYLRTRFDDETHKELYQNRTNDDLSPLIPINDFEIQKQIEKRDDFLNEILEFNDGKGKLIDIGSSWGAFISRCQSKGFDAEGIEPASELRNFGIENFNLNINENDFLDINYPDNSIDVITSLFSLYSLSNPKAVIEKVFKILKPNGLFCGILPNIDSIASETFEDDWEGIEPYKNTVYFSFASLERHLIESGFVIKKLYTDIGDFDEDLLIDIILDSHNPEDKIDLGREIQNIASMGKGEEIRFFAVKPEIIEEEDIDIDDIEKNEDDVEDINEELQPKADEVENIIGDEDIIAPKETIKNVDTIESLPKTNNEELKIIEIELKPNDDYEAVLSDYLISKQETKQETSKIVLIDKYNLVPEFAENWNGIEIRREKPDFHPENNVNSESKIIKEESGTNNNILSEDMTKDESSETPIKAMNRLSFEEDFGFSNHLAFGKLPDILPSPLYLNLGCGNDIINGFINLDLFSNDERVVKMDIRKLEFESESVDLILANDILEHFSHREIDNLLTEWSRVLKVGGHLIVRCPSLRLQAKAYIDGKWNADIASYMIFGGQTNPGDYHCVAFDKESISRHLNNAGFEILEFDEEDIPQNQSFINLNMNVKAVKMKINITENNKNSTGLFSGFNFDDNDDEKEKIENPKTNKPELNIVWEGDQFIYHSLALVNREHCSNIIDTELTELTIVPFGEDKFSPKGNEKYEKLLDRDIRVKQGNPKTDNLPYVWIRHQWPTKSEEPKGAKWIIMQPWEYSRIWKSTAEIFNRADEIWTPSNYSRQSFINSGIDFNKVQIIPNGVDPELFSPVGDKYQLPTNKKFKFLFVGGTIWRKGIDLVLEAYKAAFSPNDDICLVIKDLGTDSFYKGMDAHKKIQEFAENPQYPEVVYINKELSEEEVAGLYRACDVLVNPYRGEGFSLPTLEAMACGLPVIVTQGGATDDYCDEQVAWLIPSKEKSIGYELDGKELTDEASILEPDLENLIKVIRTIYDTPNEILSAGILASYRARSQWTWKKATVKIFSRLDYLYKTKLATKAENILTDNQDASIILGEAELNYINRNFVEAQKLYKQALDSSDLNEKWKIHSINHLALININNSNLDEAQNYLNKTKDDNLYQVDNLYLQAKIHIAKEEWTETLEILTELMNNWVTWKYQTVIGISLDLLLCDTGKVLLNLKDIENALNIYKQALKINEYSGLACLGAAKCFIEINAVEDAKKMLDWAIKLEPNLVEAKELLDLSLFKEQ